ncbi:MAG: hypothetical protein K5868_08005 [Lachnospiraceae bacterium]|nr:hypothetical protein [Lachnospiraceae bacterium]
MANDNIRQYRKPLNINIGIICFLVIMVYIIICSFMYFTSKHIVGYEVKAGSLSITNVYEGIAIRDESVVTSEHSGYVNYYAREGEKVSSGGIVCSVDETGQLQDLMNKEATDGIAMLNESDISEIKNEIVDFSTAFDNKNFQSAYDFKYAIEGSVMKFMNSNLLSNMETLNSENAAGLINLCYSPESGIVVYSVDGFEEYSPADVEKAWFKKEDYDKKQLINNELVSSGDVLYKLTDNEEWSIIIPIERERAEQLLEEEYVKVRFLKNRNESWGRVEIIESKEGDTYAQLHFNNSMITFATDRFIDVELITDVESGLKVPNSSIVTKQFFLIPKDYVIKSGNNNSDSVLRETYAEDGSKSTEPIPVTIYSENETEYYINDDELRIGDRILMPDSMQDYTISKVAELTGVYNINKGYADFKQIQILNQNDEYSIIKSNTDYGLITYDYIVLDADSVETDEFIYD